MELHTVNVIAGTAHKGSIRGSVGCLAVETNDWRCHGSLTVGVSGENPVDQLSRMPRLSRGSPRADDGHRAPYAIQAFGLNWSGADSL